MALLAVGEVNYLSFLLLKQHLHPTVANNETAFIAPLERYSSITNNTKRRESWLLLLSVHYFDSWCCLCGKIIGDSRMMLLNCLPWPVAVSGKLQ